MKVRLHFVKTENRYNPERNCIVSLHASEGEAIAASRAFNEGRAMSEDVWSVFDAIDLDVIED